jgi:hypothetical protein
LVPECKPDITYVDGFLNIGNYGREIFFISLLNLELGYLRTYRNGLVDLQAVNPDIKNELLEEIRKRACHFETVEEDCPR